ncbi:MAG: M12 family metallopeptidase [Fibrobacterota bacterium]
MKNLMKSLMLALVVLLAVGCGNNPFSTNPAGMSTEAAALNSETEGMAPVSNDAPLLLDEGDYYLLGGDIALNKDDEEHASMINELNGTASALAKTSGMRQMFASLWPKGKVAYRLKGFTVAETKIVRAAMDSVQRVCNVLFTAAPASQVNYVYTITRVKGQSYGGMSTLGYTKKPWCNLNQVIWGTAVHEFLHGLAISHEHQRFDRDKYVTIYTKNASTCYASQFAIVPQYLSYKDAKGKVTKYENSRIYGTYDYASIMHYPTWAFSTNGKATIVSKVAGKTIGQRTTLSKVDRSTLVTLYGAVVKK